LYARNRLKIKNSYLFSQLWPGWGGEGRGSFSPLSPPWLRSCFLSCVILHRNRIGRRKCDCTYS